MILPPAVSRRCSALCNDYLAFVYGQLRDAAGPLVVFGHSLGEQACHLIDAANANPERPFAISMGKKTQRQLREQQSDYLRQAAHGRGAAHSRQKSS
jgi:hypothetical protein